MPIGIGAYLPNDLYYYYIKKNVIKKIYLNFVIIVLILMQWLIKNLGLCSPKNNNGTWN